MSTTVKLLPLPAHFAHQHDNVKKIVREYAIANMAELADDRDDLLARLDASIDHGMKLGAAMQRCLDEVLEQKAEIEALRGEVRDAYAAADSKAGWEWKKRAEAAETRAERLAEALRDIESRPWNGVRPIQIAARAALRDHDQEVSNG